MYRVSPTATASQLISPSLTRKSIEATVDPDTSSASIPTATPPFTFEQTPSSSSSQTAQPLPQQPDKPLRLANLSKKLDDFLKDAGQEAPDASSSSTDPPTSSSTTPLTPNQGVDGRLGPKKVAFDPNSKVGNVILDSDHLGVTSQSNFSTVRANTCVYKGR